MDILFGLLLLVGGLLTLYAIVIKRSGMNTRRAQVLVKIIGVTGAKIVYIVMSVFAIVYGFMLLMGITTF